MNLCPRFLAHFSKKIEAYLEYVVVITENTSLKQGKQKLSTGIVSSIYAYTPGGLIGLHSLF